MRGKQLHPIIGALKAEALLNESIGVGYINRHWPPAFMVSPCG